MLELHEDELKSMELRYQVLLLAREGRENPVLEKKIEAYEDNIDVKRVKIKRLMENLG
jgi:hypothetical protein